MIRHIPLALAVVLTVDYRLRFLSEKTEAGFSVCTNRNHDHAEEKRGG